MMPYSIRQRTASRSHLSQFVQLNPKVSIDKPSISAPINIELGGLPLSIGLFAGSGLSFLARSGLPKGWPQTTAAIVGAILGVGGVVNLLIPRQSSQGSTAAAPASGPVPPSGVTPGGEAAPGFAPPSVPAFSRVQIELVSPASGQEISHTGTFLGIGSPKIPIQLRLQNPTSESVTFNLEFEWDESPAVLGYNMSPSHGSKAFQVTLAPGEQRNETFELPQGSAWSTLAVALALYKKRAPGENRFLVVNSTFSVT